MVKPKIYLAGPISGLDYRAATDWRERMARLVAPEIEAFSPMRAKRYLERADRIEGSYDDHPISTAKAIVSRDRRDCMTSDLVVFNFLGVERVSIGSCIEIGWADAARRPAVLIIEELPFDNPHDHLMIRELCAFQVHDIFAAAEVCRAALLSDDFEPKHAV